MRGSAFNLLRLLCRPFSPPPKENTLAERNDFPTLDHLILDRPLIVFDLETTGVDPTTDRIVQLALVRFENNLTPPRRKRPRSFVRYFNPGCPIPAAATAVHGISDEDVTNADSFSAVAPWLASEMQQCDLCGFNIRRFDLPLVLNELQRLGIELDLSDNRIIDAFEIYKHFQPRTLEAAFLDYCGGLHENAHDALGDVIATAAVLDAQVARHDHLPADAEGIDKLFRKPDLLGRLIDIDGELGLNFGKHRGRTLADLARAEPDYLKWMLSGSFLPDVKRVVRQALDNNDRVAD